MLPETDTVRILNHWNVLVPARLQVDVGLANGSIIRNQIPLIIAPQFDEDIMMKTLDSRQVGRFV